MKKVSFSTTQHRLQSTQQTEVLTKAQLFKFCFTFLFHLLSRYITNDFFSYQLLWIYTYLNFEIFTSHFTKWKPKDKDWGKTTFIFLHLYLFLIQYFDWKVCYNEPIYVRASIESRVSLVSIGHSLAFVYKNVITISKNKSVTPLHDCIGTSWV